RDISHSSVERMLLPDHFGLLAYTLRRMKNVVENLVIDRTRIEAKVINNEKIYSSYVLHQLILENPKVKREELYETVQTAFFKSQNKDELKVHLKAELAAKQLQGDAEAWINFDNFKQHYLEQFQKIAKRV